MDERLHRYSGATSPTHERAPSGHDPTRNLHLRQDSRAPAPTPAPSPPHPNKKSADRGGDTEPRWASPAGEGGGGRERVRAEVGKPAETDSAAEPYSTAPQRRSTIRDVAAGSRAAAGHPWARGRGPQRLRLRLRSCTPALSQCARLQLQYPRCSTSPAD